MHGVGGLHAKEPLRLSFRMLVGAFRVEGGSSPSSVVNSIQRPLKEDGVQSNYGGRGESCFRGVSCKCLLSLWCRFSRAL